MRIDEPMLSAQLWLEGSAVDPDRSRKDRHHQDHMQENDLFIARLRADECWRSGMEKTANSNAPDHLAELAGRAGGRAYATSRLPNAAMKRLCAAKVCAPYDNLTEAGIHIMGTTQERLCADLRGVPGGGAILSMIKGGAGAIFSPLGHPCPFDDACARQLHA